MSERSLKPQMSRRAFLKSVGTVVGTSLVVPYLQACVPAAAPQAAAPEAPSADELENVIGIINIPDVRKFEGTRINLAVQKHSATDAIEALSDHFERQTGIEVNFEQIPQQQMGQKQLTDLSTGTGTYDVIGWFLNPEYVENDWITPIEELRQDSESTDEALLAIDDFFDPFLAWNTYKDVLYGLPFYGESIMMYYNTAEFERAGIEKAPETIAELEEACKKIKEGGRMAGIALRASQEGNAGIYPFMAWLHGYGGSWVDNSTYEIGLDKPESVEAAASWGHFLREYGPADVASYFWNEVQLAIQQEVAAIIMDATNFGPRLEDPDQSKIAGSVGYAPLPMVIGPDGPRGPERSQGRFGHPAIAYGLSVPRSAKNWQAAWLFNQWATSPEVMLETTQLGQRGDPTRRSTLSSDIFIEKYNYGDGIWAKTLFETFDLALPDYLPREVVTISQLGDMLGLALSQIVTGERTAEEAFLEAQEKSVEIQQDAGLL